MLPQLQPTFFEKIETVQEINLSKSWEYLGSWNTSKTEGLFFGPNKQVIHYPDIWSVMSGYKTWLWTVMNCNWSNIWTMNDLLFSDQNITPWFLRCSNFPNIPMILIIFLSYTTSIFSKTSATTVTTLLMIQHQLQHQLLKQAPTALDNKNSSTLCELVLWTLKLNPVHQKHQAFLLSYIPDVLDISDSPRV